MNLRYRGPVDTFLIGLAGFVVALCMMMLVIVLAVNKLRDEELKREIERAKAGLPAKKQGR